MSSEITITSCPQSPEEAMVAIRAAARAIMENDKNISEEDHIEKLLAWIRQHQDELGENLMPAVFVLVADKIIDELSPAQLPKMPRQFDNSAKGKMSVPFDPERQARVAKATARVVGAIVHRAMNSEPKAKKSK